MPLSSQNIDAGQFRNRVTFRNNTGQAALGAGFKDGYEDFLTCWGMLRQERGMRLLGYGEISLDNSYTLYTRYYSALETNLKSNTQVQIDSRTFTIDSMIKVDEMDFFYCFTLSAIQH